MEKRGNIEAGTQKHERTHVDAEHHQLGHHIETPHTETHAHVFELVGKDAVLDLPEDLHLPPNASQRMVRERNERKD